MISVKDRIPAYPGRVNMNPVAGQSNVFDMTRADSPTEMGTGLNRRTMQLLQADIRTLRIAAGQTITARDVVNVVSNRVTKSGAPTQAIALQSGTAGQSIDIIFDGVTELPGITAGTQITSAGVQGYAPQDGWLWVRPSWDVNYVVGKYLGNGVNGRVIDIGFTPSFVLVGGGRSGMCIITKTVSFGVKSAYPVTWVDPSLTDKIVANGFTVSATSGNRMNENHSGGDENNFAFNYIAFK